MINRMYRATRESEEICGRFVHVGVRYELCWRVIETAFESRIRILTGAIINSKYIEPRRFLEDAIKIVLEHVHFVIQL